MATATVAERAVVITPQGNLLWSFPAPSFERAFIRVRSVKDFARHLEHEKGAEAGGGRDDKHL